MRGRELAAYAICCLVWGTTWLVIKIGLEDLPPLWFAGIRMALASALLVPLALRASWRGLTRADWGHVVMVGALSMFVSYGLVFTAQVSIPSGLMAVLFGTYPIWAGLYAHVLLPSDRLTPARAMSAVIGLAGLTVLQLPALSGVTISLAMWGPLLLALGSPFVSGFTSVWVKRRLTHVPPAVNLWAQTLVGASLLLATSSIVERGAEIHWTLRAVLCVAYLAAVGTALCFLLLFWLLPRVPIAVIGIMPLIDTLIALMLGTLVADEPLTWNIGLGAALILGGAALANGPPAPAPSTQAAASALPPA